MAAEAIERGWGYPRELVQVMKEHELLAPGEDEQMIDYLFLTM